MGWKMDSSGKWIQTGDGSSGTKTAVDKGNTSDTNSAIKSTTENKTDTTKYAEEANFSTDGNPFIRIGGNLMIGKGVASRWQGLWKILSTTHTVDSRGYKTEGTVGRIPYKEDSGDKKKTDTASKSSDKKSDVASTDNSGSKWVMNSDGTWKKVGA